MLQFYLKKWFRLQLHFSFVCHSFFFSYFQTFVAFRVIFSSCVSTHPFRISSWASFLFTFFFTKIVRESIEIMERICKKKCRCIFVHAQALIVQEFLTTLCCVLWLLLDILSCWKYVPFIRIKTNNNYSPFQFEFTFCCFDINNKMPLKIGVHVWLVPFIILFYTQKISFFEFLTLLLGCWLHAT